MKKTLLSLTALALIATASQAQDDNAKSSGATTFGVHAGVGMAKFNGDDEAGEKLDSKFAAKFNVGVDAQIPIATDFYIQPGLNFQSKGAKFEDGSDEFRLNLFYVDIPVSFVYKTASSHFFGGFGPYVGFGVGGKATTNVSGAEDVDIEFRNDITAAELLADDKVYFKRMDAGANVFLGYEFVNGLAVKVGTQIGLTNINTDIEGATADQSKTKNIGFGLTIGYRFGK